METNTFTTHAEYLLARNALDTNNAASLQYCKEHKTNGIPQAIYSKFPYADMVNNDLRSKVEVYEFILDKPANYFLYISEDTQTATTWTGSKLGHVHFGREYRSNFGDKRQPIDIFGINGVKYHGIYYKDAGNYARIKAYKQQLSHN